MQPSRRNFLWRFGGGLGGIALANLLGADNLLAAPVKSRLPHYAPKAKRVVQLYMSGAASQCDTFDYKPRLIRDHGKTWDPGEKVELFQSNPGQTLKSPWPWRRYGASGKWINDCVAPLGGVVDDIAFVHNVVSKSNVHGPATFMQATGFILPGFPSAGAWVSYGLGSLSDNLPTFVVLPDPRGFAPNGPKNWGAAFLPAEHQGTMIRPSAANPSRSPSFVTNFADSGGNRSLIGFGRPTRIIVPWWTAGRNALPQLAGPLGAKPRTSGRTTNVGRSSARLPSA